MAIVILSGEISVTSNRGQWHGLERDNVFASASYALYLPRQTDFTIQAARDSEFAVTWVPTDEDHEAWLIKPEDMPRHASVAHNLRGGDNVTRQIVDTLPPGSPVHRLVLVEVYTPSGGWSAPSSAIMSPTGTLNYGKPMSKSIGAG